MDTQPHGGGGGGSANSSPQQFCLRWHNHQTSLLSSLPLLLDQSHLTDVTLIAEGRNIKAHRVVLSACSTFFSELFRTLDGPSLYPVIVLPGASFPAVVALLTFMYSGEVNVYEEQISTLLSLAETLGIKGLADFSGNSHNKSTTPSTDEASSSRESEIPSPPYPVHHQAAAIKMESPGELHTHHHTHHQPSPSPFFPRPPSTSSSSAAAAFNFHSPLFPQALNLATNNNNSSSSNNNNNQNHNGGKSADLFSRFLPQKCDMTTAMAANEALWKMNEESEAINRDNKSGPSGGSCLEDRQSVNANNKNNSGTSIAGTAAGLASDDEKQQNSGTPKNETESVAANTSPKFNFDSNSNHLHHDSTAPSTPSSNPDEHRMQQQQSLNTCSTKKSASQENKRKKIDKIAENLRTQTAASASAASAAAAAAAASFNKHLLQSLKSFPPSSQSPLSQLHLFSKPPTATPVSSNQQPSFLAHHFLTNESASKTPENLILESAHPSGHAITSPGGPASSTTCSPSSSATMAMVAAAAAAHHLGGMSPQQQQHQQQHQQQQKPPTKLYATCFICNKQLSNQYNLRVHLETHQNVRYACTVCSHVSRSKDALRKHVSYRHPGTPSPCDPDTKRKRSKANLGQMIKQEAAMLNDQASTMSQLIKQEIMNSDQQHQQQSISAVQQQHTNQLLANLTSQGNSIVSIPTFLQQAASMQSAFSATKSMLFNTAQIATSMAPPTSQMSQTEGVCNTLSQPKDLSNNLVESSSSNNNGSKKLDNGSPERMDEGSNTVATAAEESKPNGSAL